MVVGWLSKPRPPSSEVGTNPRIHLSWNNDDDLEGGGDDFDY